MFLLVTVGTSIAGAVCLFRSKGAKFIIVAAALAIGAEVIGTVIIGFGIGKILGLVGGVLGILGARQIMAKSRGARRAAARRPPRRCHAEIVRARRHIGVLVRHDLRYTLSSARGLLFLLFFSLFWAWVFSKLAGGLGEQLGTPQAGFLVSWLFDSNVARLLQERPLDAGRLFRRRHHADAAVRDARVVRSDGDRSGHTPHPFPDPAGRTRRDLRRAPDRRRLLMTFAQLLAGVAATIIALVVQSDAAGAMSTATIVALRRAGDRLPDRLFAADRRADVAGVGGDGVGGAGAAGRSGRLRHPGRGARSMMPLEGVAAKIVSFLVPGGLKPYLLQPELGPALAACGGALGYVALYSLLGWQVFRTRDA